MEAPVSQEFGRCPLCKQTAVLDDVQLHERIALIHGERVYLSPQEATVFDVLLKVWPGTAHKERLASALWPSGGPPWGESAVKVLKHTLSKKLEGLAKIHTIWHDGYSIEFLSQNGD